MENRVDRRWIMESLSQDMLQLVGQIEEIVDEALPVAEKLLGDLVARSELAESF